MRDPLPRSLLGQKLGEIKSTLESSDSWFNRVRENFAHLLIPSPLKASSANGAPIHLLKFEKSPRPARAQGASLVAHLALCAVVLLVLTRLAAPLPPRPIPTERIPLDRYTFPIIHTVAGPHPSDGGGSGGDHNPVAATSGPPPVRSAIQIVKPTLPTNQTSVMPEPPTILDPNAPAILPPTGRVGLPWMPADTNSAGPGANHGVGIGDKGTLGDGSSGPFGAGDSNAPNGPGFVSPQCAYCPYPIYSDDARKAKVQGTVTVQVLVGADGRAQDVRIIKGIGFGLDERAVETVRGWKFIPGRDSAKRPVASWVTVEAMFRLF